MHMNKLTNIPLKRSLTVEETIESKVKKQKQPLMEDVKK